MHNYAQHIMHFPETDFLCVDVFYISPIYFILITISISYQGVIFLLISFVQKLYLLPILFHNIIILYRYVKFIEVRIDLYPSIIKSNFSKE